MSAMAKNPQLPQSVLVQDFELLMPDSFQKKIITALIGEELADVKMINKLNQLWIKLERQELKALKSFLADLITEVREENRALAMLPIDDGLLEELLKALQEATEEYNETYDEFTSLTGSFNAYDDELHAIDDLLSGSVEKLFENF